MITKKLIAVTLAIVTLAACSSVPEPVSLNPQVNTTVSGNIVNLRIRDQRAHNHVMRLEQNDQTAQFAPADPSLTSLIQDRLSQRWTLEDNASAQLEVILQEGIFVIRQGSLRHDTEHKVRLQVRLHAPGVEFEKTFSGSRESNGPLRADHRRIEREFAALLADVLNDLLNDEALNRRIEEAQ